MNTEGKGNFLKSRQVSMFPGWDGSNKLSMVFIGSDSPMDLLILG